MLVYIYIYICVGINIYIYIYMFICIFICAPLRGEHQRRGADVVLLVRPSWWPLVLFNAAWFVAVIVLCHSVFVYLLSC